MNETLRFRIEAPGSEMELLIAELHSLGTLGIEEVGGTLLAYFPADAAPGPVLALADAARGIRLQGPEPVPPVDWGREWRRGLTPRRVGSLWIRPSWCASRGEPELLIDPEQGFGSGEHATTRLALELLTELLRPGERVLDVGTGSGILALAARRLGSGRTLGLDVDEQACRNARDNAARNGIRAPVVCGTLGALAGDARYDIVLANMLLGQLEPWLGHISGHAARVLVLSGYLESERERLHGQVRPLGWQPEREARETQSGDVWCASAWVHADALQ
jgi:ribosomal protein L11 methyltransferase